MLAQLNDLCPKHKQRSCRASQAQRLASFSKMRMEDLAARTDCGSSGKAHVQSLSYFQKSACHGTVMTLAFPVTFWDMPAPSLAVCF